MAGRPRLEGVVVSWTRTDAPDGPPGPAKGTLVVSNATGSQLWFLHARPRGRGGWGVELLDRVLMDGGVQEVRLEPGMYELRAETGDGTRIGKTGMEVIAGESVTWVVELE